MQETMVPYPTIPDERGNDLHGLEDIERAELVIFMAGNQFMAMADLMAAFREAHPGIGPIYYKPYRPRWRCARSWPAAPCSGAS